MIPMPSASGRPTRPSTVTRQPGSRDGRSGRTPTARLSPTMASLSCVVPELAGGGVVSAGGAGACVVVGAGTGGGAGALVAGGCVVAGGWVVVGEPDADGERARRRRRFAGAAAGALGACTLMRTTGRAAAASVTG